MDDAYGDPPARWVGLPSWLLTQTAQHAGHLVDGAFASVGARGYHYRLLATLEDLGSTSQATLSRRSGIHVSDLVAALNELAEDGLVERAPDPSDRRRNVVSLTPAGRRQLRRLQKQVLACQDELLVPLSSEDRLRLTEMLSTLLEHHNRRGSSGKKPPGGSSASRPRDHGHPHG